MTVEAILQDVRTLPVAERKRLISLIVDTLTDTDEVVVPKKRSILYFIRVRCVFDERQDL